MKVKFSFYFNCVEKSNENEKNINKIRQMAKWRTTVYIWRNEWSLLKLWRVKRILATSSNISSLLSSYHVAINEYAQTWVNLMSGYVWSMSTIPVTLRSCPENKLTNLSRPGGFWEHWSLSWWFLTIPDLSWFPDVSAHLAVGGAGHVTSIDLNNLVSRLQPPITGHQAIREHLHHNAS